MTNATDDGATDARGDSRIMYDDNLDRGFRGMIIALVTLALARAASPFLTSIPAESAQWIMLATLLVGAYGLFQLVTGWGAFAIEAWEEHKAADDPA